MRVKLTVAYDGTNYHGWQIQNNALSVEEVLAGALRELLGEFLRRRSLWRSTSVFLRIYG